MIKSLFAMMKEAFADWREDNASRLGAALAYYTMFSLAPLLLIAIAIAGMVFGTEAAQGRIVGQIDGLVGRAGAEAVEAALESARKPEAGMMATLVGVVMLLLGASGAFIELRSALNTIWEVEPRKGGGFLGMIRERFLSFAAVMGVGFLLLVSLLFSALLAGIDAYLGDLLPGSVVLVRILNAALSFGVITVLFALIFKFLPDTKVAWRDVWVGAVITSVLFALGKAAIGMYLGRGTAASVYGAAGALLGILIWVYYAAQIVFFGAELTQVYARRRGAPIGTEDEAPAKEAAKAAPSASERDDTGEDSPEEREDLDEEHADPRRAEELPPSRRHARPSTRPDEPGAQASRAALDKEAPFVALGLVAGWLVSRVEGASPTEGEES